MPGFHTLRSARSVAMDSVALMRRLTGMRSRSRVQQPVHSAGAQQMRLFERHRRLKAVSGVSSHLQL